MSDINVGATCLSNMYVRSCYVGIARWQILYTFMLLKHQSLLGGCPEEAAPRHDGGAGDRSLPRMGRQRRHGCDALIRLEPLDRPGLRGGRGGSGVPPRKPHGSYAGLIRHHHVQRRERVLALAGEAASSGPANGLGMAREEAHLLILVSAQRSDQNEKIAEVASPHVNSTCQ